MTNYFIVIKRVEKVLKRIKNKSLIVAASGGKDSMFLLNILRDMNIDFSVLHIYHGYGEFSEIQKSIVENFCKNNNIELILINATKYQVFKKSKQFKRPVCSICGVLKRYILNKTAREKGFDVLMTAHNLSDIFRFLLINLSAGTLEYSAKNLPITLPSHPKQVWLAKPLYYVPETWIEKLVAEMKIEHCYLKCPYGKDVKWKKIVRFIEEINTDILYTSVRNFEKKYSKLFYKQEELSSCSICGEPTTSKDRICSFCKIFSLR